MSVEALWVESYQGEVLGETVFGLLAERERDPVRRRQLEVLTVLERATKELAEPVFERHGFDRGDTAATVATAKELGEAVVAMAWDEFLASVENLTVEFLAKYRQLVELADDDRDRTVAEAYVAHEEALAAFARRARGHEAGDPLEEIVRLGHVAPALAG